MQTSSAPSQGTASIETTVNRIRGTSSHSRREFLQRSAAAGAGTLALSVATSIVALAHDVSAVETSNLDLLSTVKQVAQAHGR